MNFRLDVCFKFLDSWRLFTFTYSLRCSHRKKFGAVKSGDLGGHGKSEFRENIRS